MTTNTLTCVINGIPIIPIPPHQSNVTDDPPAPPAANVLILTTGNPAIIPANNAITEIEVRRVGSALGHPSTIAIGLLATPVGVSTFNSFDVFFIAGIPPHTAQEPMAIK